MLPDWFPTLANLAGFTVVAVVTILSPGPDTMVILRHAQSGRRAGLLTVAGVQMGLCAHIIAAAGGLSAVLHYSPDLFRVIAMSGAIYLGYLGVSSMFATTLVFGSPLRPMADVSRLIQGFLSNILNPKVLVLFVALIPNFVVADSLRAASAQFVVFGSVLLLLNVTYQSLLVLATDRIRRHLSSSRAQRAVNVSLGAVLVMFAVLLLVEHVMG